MLYSCFVIILYALITVQSGTNPFSGDPFCVGRLVNLGEQVRRFELSENCDLKPLAKPYKNFPPSFFVPGVQKAGTSATAKILQRHTILRWRIKEPRFLNDRPDYFKSSGTPGEKWKQYESYMAGIDGPTIDGSPGYVARGDFFIENFKYITNVSLHNFPKMVIILRDPLVRVYSHYKMRLGIATNPDMVLYNKKVPSFVEFIEDDLEKLRKCGVDINLDDPNFNPRKLYSKSVMWCFYNPNFDHLDYYLVKGMYSWQLEMLRQSANSNRILVTCFNDMNAWNEGYLEMLAKFIGVDFTSSKMKASGDFIPIPSHKRAAECPMNYRKNHSLSEVSPLLEKKLQEFYEKWNAVLRKDFGIDCGWRRKLTC